MLAGALCICLMYIEYNFRVNFTKLLSYIRNAKLKIRYCLHMCYV